MNLFQKEDFISHSGLPLKWKIECDALTDGDIECLAMLIAENIGKFGQVEGVPRGGLRLAEALKPYVTEGPLLLVDDVYTTGRSMELYRKSHTLIGERVIGAVIFARNNITQHWIVPLFYLYPYTDLCDRT